MANIACSAILYAIVIYIIPQTFSVYRYFRREYTQDA